MMWERILVLVVSVVAHCQCFQVSDDELYYRQHVLEQLPQSNSDQAIARLLLTFNPAPASTHTKGRKGPLTRRNIFTAALSALSLAADPSFALFNEEIPLEVKGYSEVECPEELASGRMGGSMNTGASAGGGIAQKCVKVTATADNKNKEAKDEVAVFGVVVDSKSKMSVLANGQDGKNDAGQFAMIKKVPPGKNEVEFIFVSQQDDPCKVEKIKGGMKRCPREGTKPLVPITFQKIKAIAYPGGDRFKPYDECEQNPFLEECDDGAR
jgi:hypothetical protein